MGPKMGIKEAYGNIKMEHEAICRMIKDDPKAFFLAGIAWGLEHAMEIIEEECPEVKENNDERD